MSQFNLSFAESLLIKSILLDDRYASSIISAVEGKHFVSKVGAQIYNKVKDHYSAYKELPSSDIIINTIGSQSLQEEAAEYLKACSSIDFDINKQFDYLIDSTDEWLKQRAVQLAIMESADVISEKDSADYGKIREIMEGALTKTFRIDLGLNYFDDLGTRLKRIFTGVDVRVKTYFPMLDDILNGGFTPYTFSVFVGRIHGGKSLIMNNLICRQVMHGHNIVMFTLEMSQDAMAQRFDSILTNQDINRIYTTKENQSRLAQALAEVKNTPGRGTLFVKQYPPRGSSINDFRAYLHELSMRKFKPSIIFCDYVNLLKPGFKSKAARWEEIEQISEELRSLSFEYQCPVVSVTQINRGSMRAGLDELDFDAISGSLGIGNTADFLAMLGLDYDSQIYKSEIMYSIAKNRIGGQVGTIGKFYVDDRSLRMYDESELELWIKDAEYTRGGRGLKESKKENPQKHGSYTKH